MPKFVLIDHSIKDLSGHHYGYAAHVLGAAQRAGYEPVLATNRGFVNVANTAWPILPVYEYDFWAEVDPGPLLRFLGSTANYVIRTCAAFSGRLLYKTRNPADHLTGPRKEAPSERKTLQKIVRFLADINRRTVAANRPLPRQEVEKAFGRDTKQLFEKVQLGAGGIVFIPTISHRDMLGLLEFLCAGLQGADASWHLLFRRSLPESPPRGDAGPGAALDEIRGAFESFRRKARNRHIHFYTDSEELTEHYNQLGVSRFHTLPIPHTCSPQKRPLNEEPRRITYLGDARCEKGYHLLPAIVRDLKKDYLDTGKARFVVQSNPNPREGEGETAIARAELNCFPSPVVALHNEPLSTEAYKDLLLGSHITLLPYDPKEYSARSSGILAESLAAGIPVIVPAGTWLSRQLQPATRRAEDLQADRLNQRSGQSVPLGGVGLAYHEIQEIPDLIRNIVDHYPHYRETAVQFAGEWRDYHNPDRLVEEILRRSREPQGG